MYIGREEPPVLVNQFYSSSKRHVAPEKTFNTVQKNIFVQLLLHMWTDVTFCQSSYWFFSYCIIDLVQVGNLAWLITDTCLSLFPKWPQVCQVKEKKGTFQKIPGMSQVTRMQQCANRSEANRAEALKQAVTEGSRQESQYWYRD